MAFELEKIAGALDENYTSGFEMETIAEKIAEGGGSSGGGGGTVFVDGFLTIDAGDITVNLQGKTGLEIYQLLEEDALVVLRISINGVINMFYPVVNSPGELLYGFFSIGSQNHYAITVESNGNVTASRTS